MRKLLFAMFVALLMVGCGEEGQNPEDSNDTGNNASALVPPVAQPVNAPPVVQPVNAPFVDKWAEWEANPEPYGGAEVLAKVKEVKESGAAQLDLYKHKISDLSPLAGLTELEKLSLVHNQITDISPLKGLTNLEKLGLWDNQITDVSPLAGLTNLEVLGLHRNKISDLSPLKGLTNLKALWLHGNQISDISPLKGLTKLEGMDLKANPISEDQKAMLKKALPDCDIRF